MAVAHSRLPSKLPVQNQSMFLCDLGVLCARIETKPLPVFEKNKQWVSSLNRSPLGARITGEHLERDPTWNQEDSIN